MSYLSSYDLERLLASELIEHMRAVLNAQKDLLDAALEGLRAAERLNFTGFGAAARAMLPGIASASGVEADWHDRVRDAVRALDEKQLALVNAEREKQQLEPIAELPF